MEASLKSVPELRASSRSVSPEEENSCSVAPEEESPRSVSPGKAFFKGVEKKKEVDIDEAVIDIPNKTILKFSEEIIFKLAKQSQSVTDLTPQAESDMTPAAVIDVTQKEGNDVISNRIIDDGPQKSFD